MKRLSFILIIIVSYLTISYRQSGISMGVSMYSPVPQEYRLGVNFGLTRAHLYLDIFR